MICKTPEELMAYNQGRLDKARDHREDSDQRLVRLLESWGARFRATPERAKAGGVDYVGGLIDAYGACFRELQEIIEANSRDQQLTP